MKLRQVLLAFALATFLASCGLVTIYPTYHYRLTVEVDTPQGLRTGSSVIEVRTSEIKSTLGGAGAEITGEAVAVDLPNGQTLFALLRSESSVDWAKQAVNEVQLTNTDPIPDGKLFSDGVKATLTNTPHALPRHLKPHFSADDPLRSGYPMLVRFVDIHDPKSVAKVDPDNLASSFGAGVSLRRITVQLTKDPVTKGIEKRFSWWLNFRDKHFDGTSAVSEDMRATNLTAHMNSGDFTTEYRK